VGVPQRGRQAATLRKQRCCLRASSFSLDVFFCSVSSLSATLGTLDWISRYVVALFALQIGGLRRCIWCLMLWLVPQRGSLPVLKSEQGYHATKAEMSLTSVGFSLDVFFCSVSSLSATLGTLDWISRYVVALFALQIGGLRRCIWCLMLWLVPQRGRQATTLRKRRCSLRALGLSRDVFFCSVSSPVRFSEQADCHVALR